MTHRVEHWPAWLGGYKPWLVITSAGRIVGWYATEREATQNAEARTSRAYLTEHQA